MTTSVTPTTSSTTTSTSSSGGLDNAILSKDDFLKLLIAQVQNQDPMNPQDPTQSMQQMTFFSMVEQLMNISTGITALQHQEDLTSAATMIGHSVTYVDSNGKQQTQTVDHVDSDPSAGVQLALADGTKISLKDVAELK